MSIYCQTNAKWCCNESCIWAKTAMQRPNKAPFSSIEPKNRCIKQRIAQDPVSDSVHQAVTKVLRSVAGVMRHDMKAAHHDDIQHDSPALSNMWQKLSIHSCCNNVASSCVQLQPARPRGHLNKAVCAQVTHVELGYKRWSRRCEQCGASSGCLSLTPSPVFASRPQA